jgi:hypothetical protein
MERQFTNRGPQYEVWDLTQLDDLWYATLASSAPNRETPMVLVSTDLNRWAVCGWLAPGQGMYQTVGYYAGRLGDWLHYIVATDTWGLRHGRVRAVKVAEVNGVCVSPPKTNLLSESESWCSTVSDWRVEPTPDVLEADQNSQFFSGRPSLHVQKSDMEDDEVVTLRLLGDYDGSAGTPYRLHVWVRGQAKKLALKITAEANEVITDFSLRADADGKPLWTEIWTPAVSYPVPVVLRPRIRIWANDVDRTAELRLGAAELSAVPVEGEWVPGGSSSPIEHFDCEGLMLGSTWTHVFSTVLLSGTDDLGNTGRSYIRTYDVPLVGQAELYFECSEKQFKLSVNGLQVAASAPRTLLAGTRVYFAVRQEQGALHLSISDGHGVEHIAGSVSPTLLGHGSIRSGNGAATEVAAQVYLEDRWYADCALSDNEVEALFLQAKLGQ